MTGLQIAFLLIAGITLASAIMVVGAKKTMHSAMWLVLALMGVAAVFATLQASFYAVVQLLVYIGAIAILILFAVMLTRGALEDAGGPTHKRWWMVALAGTLFFGGLVWALRLWSGFTAILVELPKDAEHIAEFGAALVDPGAYLIPFEAASVLLLAGMVAAIYLSVERKGGRT